MPFAILQLRDSSHLEKHSISSTHAPRGTPASVGCRTGVECSRCSPDSNFSCLRRRSGVRRLSFHQSSVDLHTAVSYTHLRAHETPEHLVCRLLLEKKN